VYSVTDSLLLFSTFLEIYHELWELYVNVSWKTFPNLSVGSFHVLLTLLIIWMQQKYFLMSLVHMY